MLLFITAGFLSAVFCEALKLVKLTGKKSFIVINIVDFCMCLISGFVFIMCIFGLCGGEFKLYQVICFGVGMLFEQIFVANLIAMPIKKVYTMLKIRAVRRKQRNDKSGVSSKS